jgi:glyoxylate/hydroxypyruvate reductase A
LTAKFARPGPPSAARYLAPNSAESGSREERDRLLAEAEVIFGGWPFPLDLRARAPRLKWFHQRQAGASNLLGSDLWGSDIVVATSRGAADPLPIAEYAIPGILHFAMAFNRAAVDREAGAFDHRAYRPLLIQGKTVCVVGAGGIGLEVGRLCAALGMRVVGTRRREQPGAPLPQGFSRYGVDCRHSDGTPRRCAGARRGGREAAARPRRSRP